MRVCVCVRACVFVFVCAYVSVCVRAHVCACVYGCTYVSPQYVFMNFLLWPSSRSSIEKNRHASLFIPTIGGCLYFTDSCPRSP